MNDDVITPRNVITPLRLSFQLLGSFDPNFITNFLGITPTYAKVKSDGGQGRHKVVKDFWIIDSDYPDYYNTGKYIEAFLGELVNISSNLNKLRSIIEIEGVLSCVIWLEEDTSSPNIYLSESAIAQLKELNCSFNVSLYFL